MSGVEHDGQPNDSATLQTSCHLIAIALSAAGLEPLREVLNGLPADLPAALVVLQHIGDYSCLPALLQRSSTMRVKFAAAGERLCSGMVYVCPPGFHAMIRPTRTIALSDAPAIRYSRPCADRLLESAAASYRECALAVILSGRLSDGARGVVEIRRAGGHTIVQMPSSCGFPGMPLAAIRTGCVDDVLTPDQIAPALRVLLRRPFVGLRAWEEPFGRN
jgi:two-component system chemotaxis response regulator CheB